MSKDAASTYSFSSTAPLTGAGSSAPKSPSLLAKLLRRSPSPTKAPKSADETFREIMALNASHGDPSIQAYYVRTTPKARARSPTSSSPSPAPTPAPKRDAFAEIMALNAKHGDPSVQAYFVK